MSITALVCKIAVGVGTLTVAPGIVQTPRYDGAEVRIVMDGAKLVDVLVNGTWDKNYSYAAHGFKLTATRLADRVLLEASIEGLDVVRESLLLADSGSLLWTQLANADVLRASSASLFTGHCEPAQP